MKNNDYILIVDDDEISNYVAQQAIQSVKHETEIVTLLNGMEAIDYFKKNQSNLPLYVLLDINMPLLNGFEFLSWYESSIFRGSTKILMYTTSIRKKERDRAGKFEDVVAYIEKPISHQLITKYFNNENLMY